MEKSNTEELITITKQEYDELCRDQNFLTALQSAGVDNWEGYDMARGNLIRNGK
jgi:hypothetical protein